jgi:hypothetical protein
MVHQQHKEKIMYVSDYTVQLLHEDRLRDAEKHHALNLLRDPSEQAPVVVEISLMQQIKHLLRRNHQNQPQPVRDVRRATAV